MKKAPQRSSEDGAVVQEQPITMSTFQRAKVLRKTSEGGNN